MIPEVKYRRKNFMSNILGFDTSTNMCTVALSVGDTIDSISELAPRKHTQLVLSMVDTLFKRNALALQDLDAISFGNGPGSFMGVRLATSVAQALAYAGDLQVIPVSTLQLLAQQAYHEVSATQVIAAWDARMAEMYFGCYQLAGNNLMEVNGSDTLIKPAQFNLPMGEWLLVGNAWDVYKDVLPFNCEKLTDLYPNAEVLVAIAKKLFSEKKTVSALQATPNYIRDKVADTPKKIS